MTHTEVLILPAWTEADEIRHADFQAELQSDMDDPETSPAMREMLRALQDTNDRAAEYFRNRGEVRMEVPKFVGGLIIPNGWQPRGR